MLFSYEPVGLSHAYEPLKRFLTKPVPEPPPCVSEPPGVGWAAFDTHCGVLASRRPASAQGLLGMRREGFPRGDCSHVQGECTMETQRADDLNGLDPDDLSRREVLRRIG